jgi:hypothetical protein
MGRRGSAVGAVIAVAAGLLVGCSNESPSGTPLVAALATVDQGAAPSPSTGGGRTTGKAASREAAPKTLSPSRSTAAATSRSSSPGSVPFVLAPVQPVGNWRLDPVEITGRETVPPERAFATARRNGLGNYLYNGRPKLALVRWTAPDMADPPPYSDHRLVWAFRVDGVYWDDATRPSAGAGQAGVGPGIWLVDAITGVALGMASESLPVDCRKIDPPDPHCPIG